MVKRRSILALYLPGQPATRHTAPMIANGMALTEQSSLKSDLKRPRTDPTLAFLLCLHPPCTTPLALANPLLVPTGGRVATQ